MSEANDGLIQAVEGRSEGNLILDRFDDAVRGVAEYHRARAHHEVDIFFSVGVPHATSLATRNDEPAFVGELKHSKAGAGQIAIGEFEMGCIAFDDRRHNGSAFVEWT